MSTNKKLSRRDLFRNAALAAPMIVPASVLGNRSPSNTLTMAVIGTGNNGTGWMKNFFKDPRIRIVAVCDVNRETAGYWDGTVRGWAPAQRLVNENYGDNSCRAYQDFREVLERGDIDAIYNGTPDHWHAIINIAAARAGKDIYGQKPLSLTIEEGRAMSDVVNSRKIVWQTGSQQRSDWNFRRVCELVRNGRIGKLHTVRVGLPGGTPDFGKVAGRTDPEPVPDGFDYDFWLGPAPDAPYCPARVGVNFRWNFDYSGGQLTDWGAHHIDIAQWGMGTQYGGPAAIKNAKGKFAEGPIYNTATEYYFECEYAGGAKMIVGTEERRGVTFEGTGGWVWATRGRHEASSREIMESQIGPNEIHLYKSEDHTRNFIDCMISRAPTAAPIEVAHRSITIAHLGNIALKQGRDLRWDPEREVILDDSMLGKPYRGPWKL